MQAFLTRRRALAGMAAVLATGGQAQERGEVFEGLPGTRVRFASVQVGRAVLTADDDWLPVTSRFQRQAVMQSPRPVTLEEFRRWNGDAVRAWDNAQVRRWQRALQEIAPAFARLRIPLPAEVWLVASNGQESANAPYTRANAVVLPAQAHTPRHGDAMLLAHELWHVASRHAPALATRLYGLLGFDPVPRLTFPAPWEDRRIVNPDAPDNRHAIRLSVHGRTALYTPVLVATRTELRSGENFFHVMQPRLLRIEPDSAKGVSRAALEGGAPIWEHMDGPHNYLDLLGGNTGYVMHVEEALADNIAFLATGLSVRNPGLLDRIRRVLTESARA